MVVPHIKAAWGIRGDPEDLHEQAICDAIHIDRGGTGVNIVVTEKANLV